MWFQCDKRRTFWINLVTDRFVRKVNLEKLTKYERNVYKAIADYYIIQFLPNALKEKTEAAFTLCDKNDFKITSNTLVELGYKAYLRGELLPLNLKVLKELRNYSIE